MLKPNEIQVMRFLISECDYELLWIFGKSFALKGSSTNRQQKYPGLGFRKANTNSKGYKCNPGATNDDKLGSKSKVQDDSLEQFDRETEFAKTKGLQQTDKFMQIPKHQFQFRERSGR
jgi:hypothetical protein